MILVVLTSVLITLWILFCAGTYLYHYIVEVVLDLPITGESPCTAHAALKLLIQRIVNEALELPSFKNLQTNQSVDSADESNRTYEDLLASAIINKVISNNQNNIPSSSANSVSSRISTSSKIKDDGKEYFFGEETIDSKWKTTDLDSTSISSLEEWIHSDSSLGSTKFVDKVSLTIQHRIEEVSSTDSENEDEGDSTYFKNHKLLNDENPNWILQKRCFQGTHSPVPVPMLVPNPSEEAKVLIGDKVVEETSDLSEVESDYGDTETYQDVKQVLVDSKRIIGGKNPVESIGNLSDDELSADSGVKDGSESFDKEAKNVPKTDKSVDDDNIEDASILSSYSNAEKDTEYTERYASIPRTVYKSTSSPGSDHYSEIQDTYEIPEKESHHENDDDDEDVYESIEFAGVYSRKEKEKWKNAIDMKNNPYTKENLEKRLSSKNSLNLFGSDYYARLASKPSGGKKLNNDAEVNGNAEPFWTSDEHKEPETHSDSEPKINENCSEPLGNGVDNNLVEGKMKDDVDTPLKSAIASDPEVTASEITSDSDMSYINCYDVTNSKVYRKPSTELESNDANKPKSLENSLPINGHSQNNDRSTENHVDKSDVSHPASVNGNISSENEKPVYQKNEANIKNYKKSTIDRKIDYSFAQPKSRKNSDSELTNNETNSTAPVILSKKSDNTLIKKIYADPSVRSFALSKRNALPISMPEKKASDNRYHSASALESGSESEKYSIASSNFSLERSISSTSLNRPPPALRSKTVKRSFSETPLQLVGGSTSSLSEDSTPEIGKRETSKPIGDATYSEIEQLQQKKLVASRLGQFSMSYPNVSKVNSQKPDIKGKTHSKHVSCHIEEEVHISVQSLRKLFEKTDEVSRADKPIYSLTARSLSKQVRETLKSQNMDEPPSIEVVKNEENPLVSWKPSKNEPEPEEIELKAENKMKFYELLAKE